ncbi:MAG: 6-phosphogluconolactonase [Chlorobiaceae bacterium]|nr:6-phosphogluconolactonase [Chlorobiaceae bacterium]
MNEPTRTFRYCGNEKEITEHAAALVFSIAFRSIHNRGRFSMVLSGGNSPRPLYLLISKGISTQLSARYGLEVPGLHKNHGDKDLLSMPWENTWMFWGDERCVPPGHHHSNYRMAEETLLNHSHPQESHIFRMPADREPYSEAAASYEQTLRNFFHIENAENPARFPVFDLVLLGMGEDGHIASLFPDNTAALHESRRWVLAVDAPADTEPRVKRLTMSLPVINHARNILFFTTGSKKALLSEKIFLGTENKVPASRVKPSSGNLYWYCAQP